MFRVTIQLDGQELSALNWLAERERRDRKAQAAVIIRQVLEQRGLLAPDPAPAPQLKPARQEQPA